jgi:hypothetical protein
MRLGWLAIVGSYHRAEARVMTQLCLLKPRPWPGQPACRMPLRIAKPRALGSDDNESPRHEGILAVNRRLSGQLEQA